ncbi:hypothetical protein TRFO_09060 [Tritrichomonas foetus]|uniref:LIM zinc-binding domain-containing protein n=1 Tax=Tritrichomonas foetus TaxID=1144522 RepID=A0A1J4JKS4_9EUKA|nr:hypothetical protein TRFO_09060 [Tritrichomonas foetus]|eukprot:OHS98187.1 hypothetical protein TRFO_09060 [Tritrichomonas foetus]
MTSKHTFSISFWSTIHRKSHFMENPKNHSEEEDMEELKESLISRPSALSVPPKATQPGEYKNQNKYSKKSQKSSKKSKKQRHDFPPEDSIDGGFHDRNVKSNMNESNYDLNSESNTNFNTSTDFDAPLASGLYANSSVSELPTFNMNSDNLNNISIPDIDYNPSVLPSVLNTGGPIHQKGNIKYNPSNFDSFMTLEMESVMDSVNDNLPQLPVQPSLDSIPSLEGRASSGNLPEIIVPSSFPIDAEGIPVNTCEICRQPIEYDGLFANGIYYHKSCAKCSICRCQVEEPKCAYLKDNLCCLNCVSKNNYNTNVLRKSQGRSSSQDSFNGFKKCMVCDEILDGTKSFDTINDELYVHSNCLSCYECSKIIMKGQQKKMNNKIFCRRCYAVVRERICDICKEPTIGDFVKCHKKFYHREHFKCSVCEEILKGNNYVIHHNKLFCPTHGQFYTSHCAFCKGSLFSTNEERIRFSGKTYHTVCFICRVCGVELKQTNAKLFHSRPHCQECYNRRIRETSSGNEQKRHHHYPNQAQERRTRFKEDGMKVTLPVYTKPNNRFLEKVIEEKEEKEGVPRKLRLSSFEFDDL